MLQMRLQGRQITSVQQPMTSRLGLPCLDTRAKPLSACRGQTILKTYRRVQELG